MFRKKSFLIALALFILLNISLYLFILLFNSAIKFDVHQYGFEAYHYFYDPRMLDANFNFLRGMGAWDAQWYLKIAADKSYLFEGLQGGNLSYAFFPLYPIILVIVNFFIHNVELSAFILANVLLLLNFFSLYYVVTKLYSDSVALRTIFLLFLFPFGIFYRSYFTEGLFLLLLTWFAYFVIRKKLFIAALVTSLLFVTRPNGTIVSLIFYYSLYKSIRNREISVQKVFVYILLSIIPFSAWLYYCYTTTGDALYWYHVQSFWYSSPSIFQTVIHNVVRVFTYWQLPFHGYSYSQIDTLIVIFACLFLVDSKRILKPQLWWISLILWIVPLLVKDTMSYSRYQSVSFPIFIYLAYLCRGVSFTILASIFGILLFITSILFVNWYWIG
jgi:Gpi18-like mannosyltransferase